MRDRDGRESVLLSREARLPEQPGERDWLARLASERMREGERKRERAEGVKKVNRRKRKRESGCEKAKANCGPAQLRPDHNAPRVNTEE